MHQNKTAKRSPQKGRASLTDIIANKTSQHCEAFGIDGSNDLSQKIARALKTITVYDFYDEIFQKRYITKGSGKDAEVQKAHEWLSDAVVCMLGEADMHSLTMRELADRIGDTVDSVCLGWDERMNYYTLCHVLTDEMRLANHAVLPGIDRTDEMNRYDTSDYVLGSDFFRIASDVRDNRLIKRTLPAAADNRRPLDEILKEAGYLQIVKCGTLKGMMNWNARTFISSWLTSRYQSANGHIDWTSCMVEDDNFTRMVHRYTGRELSCFAPFTHFAAILSDCLICARKEEGLSLRTMEHYELCYQFIMLMAGKNISKKHTSLMRIRGVEGYKDYYEQEEADFEELFSRINEFEEAENNQEV